MASHFRSPAFNNVGVEVEQAPSWSNIKSWFPQSLSFVFLLSFLSSPYVFDSAKLLILGSIIETGMEYKYYQSISIDVNWIFRQKIVPMAFRTIPNPWAILLTSIPGVLCYLPCLDYSMTAHFDEGDVAYEWVVHFLVRIQVVRCINHNTDLFFRMTRRFGNDLATSTSVPRALLGSGVYPQELENQWTLVMLTMFRHMSSPSFFDGKHIGLKSRDPRGDLIVSHLHSRVILPAESL